MASVGASAAQGLQAGWQMGMQADQAERQRERDAQLQTQQDREFGLREKQYADTTARQQTADEYSLLNDEHKQLTADRAAMEAAGQTPTPEFNQRVIQNRSAFRAHIEKRRAPMLAADQAEATRMFADLQSGNLDPSTVDPAKFYRNFSLATRMTPKDLAAAAQGAQLVQQGHETGNQQILMQGVNQLAANDLKAGVGAASPHGGVVTRKEIVGLIPVKDANGVEHPDKVFPLVRTYVMHPNGAGAEDYYDAPLTQNRSSDPNDPPKAIDLAHAFDYMGKVGALAKALQHPQMAAKLAEGEKLVGAQTQADVDEMNALGKSALISATKGAVAQKIQAIYATLPPGDERDKAVRVAMGVEAAPKAPTGLAATNAAIDARPDLTPEEKTELKTLATPGQSAKAVANIKAANATANTKLRLDAKLGAATGGAGRTDISPETVDFYATMDWSGMRDWRQGLRNKEGSALIAAVDKRVPLMGKELGLTPQDMGSGKAMFAALSKSLADRIKYSAAVEQLQGTVDKQVHLVESLMDKGGVNSGLRILNEWIQAGRTATSNPDVAALDMAVRGLAREHQRVLTSPLSNAQLAVAAQKTGDELLNKAKSPAEFKALFGVIRKETENARDQTRETVGSLEHRLKSINRAPQPVAPQDGSGAPAKTQGGASVSNW